MEYDNHPELYGTVPPLYPEIPLEDERVFAQKSRRWRRRTPKN